MTFISFIIPAFNEEDVIEKSVSSVKSFLDKMKYDYEIIIANDGSDDKTTEIASKLSSLDTKIKHLYSKKRLGKGGGLKRAFDSALGNLIIFEDADLSVEISHIKNIVEEIKKGADICIGSRFLSESKVERCLLREILSRCYVLLTKLLFRTKITDFLCGFKAFRRECLPTVMETKNNGFFFDTELLLMVERKGFKLVQIPVKWKEKRKSKLNIISVLVHMFYNLLKLRISGF